MAIEIISTLKPKNNGSFPIAEAKDIDVNGVRLDEKLANMGTGSGGGGGCIIDVTELPTKGIDESAIYRVAEGLFYNRYKQGVTYVVKSLPEIGEPCTTDGTSIGTVYYNTTDGVLYGYVPAAVGSVLGVSAGWYPAATLIGALGYVYGGVVNSFAEMTESDAFYLLAKPSYNACKDGVWTELSNINNNASGSFIIATATADVFDGKDYSGTLEVISGNIASISSNPTGLVIFINPEYGNIPCVYSHMVALNKWAYTGKLDDGNGITYTFDVEVDENGAYVSSIGQGSGMPNIKLNDKETIRLTTEPTVSNGVMTFTSTGGSSSDSKQYYPTTHVILGGGFILPYNDTAMPIYGSAVLKVYASGANHYCEVTLNSETAEVAQNAIKKMIGGSIKLCFMQ